MVLDLPLCSCRCEVSLGEFLKEIKKMPDSVKFAEMANILVIHCQSSGKCPVGSHYVLAELQLWVAGMSLTYGVLDFDR